MNIKQIFNKIKQRLAAWSDRIEREGRKQRYKDELKKFIDEF